MASITKDSVLSEFKARVQNNQLARAVWHSGNLPPAGTYSTNVFTSVSGSGVDLDPRSITSATISSTNVLSAFRSWATHVRKLRRVETGAKFSRWGDHSSSSGTRYHRIDIAKVNITHQVIDPTTVVSYQPGAGNIVSLSHLRSVLDSINADVDYAVSVSSVLDLRVCHDSCHSNCHSSRGRR